MPVPTPSRRSLLAGGAAVTGALATQSLSAAPAVAARSFRVRPYRRTPAPTAWERHLMNRLGCGFSTSTYADMRKAGSAAAWLEAQLDPGSVRETKKAAGLPGWFPDLADSPRERYAKNKSGTKGSWVYAAELSGYTMMRRIYSRRQVLETMADFWSNHLHVNAGHSPAYTHRSAYDDLIRTHALGRFDELLVAATLHPAMLLYLDNWRSTKNAPNENHGRELLELHTVGRAAGYTEAMVKDSAKILSGYTVDTGSSWEGFYDTGRHTTGAVEVLGFRAANSSPDGAELARDYLRYLARHPATAQRIARKLARAFVSDDPSPGLVDHLAGVFRSSGTDIKATLRALVAHPEFAASQGALVRTPIEDFVATCRVLRVNAKPPTSDRSFARAAIWVPRTTLLYQWPTPDGSPVGDAAWASASRMLSSFRMHWALIGGWWPSERVRYKNRASWLPRKRMRFDRYVDHLCRVMLGTPSTPRILSAAVAATGYGPSTRVTRRHALAGWLHVRLAAVLLDSPDHMQR